MNATIVPTIVPTVARPAATANPWLAGPLRRRILAVLSGITGGVLTIREGDTTHRCGPAELGPGDLRATITVHHPEFWMALGLGGSVGAADAYVRKLWDTDHLTAVVRLLCRNRQALSAMDGGLVGLVAGPARRLLHALRPNTVAGAARNIHAHYDIGNDLFRLMLDPTMLYSSAIFPTPGATLEEAQTHKCDVICKRLELRPGERLIEIGTGWGGLALHAARHYGARVTTTTISQQQYALAVQRVHEAGLTDRITVLQQDYRTLEGSFDKLVSIEMVEAIGWRQYPTYLGACSRLLKPDGLALIQAITIADQEYERAKHEVDFIKQAIFPGSCIPSVTALVQAATRAGDLRLSQLDDLTPHYARTLALWRDNCHQHRDAIAALGYGEAFRRLWDYYLCYCEGGFAERAIGVHHLLFAKPGWRQTGHKAFGYA
jgi:cyclopropane-fatty-acyl-phospholipid synthase